MRNGKIDSFTDLLAWQEAHKLVLMVYKTTKSFPKEELYSTVDQMKRSATSVSANISEGFGRQSYKEKVQFYYLSKGSLSELKNFILVSKDVGFITSETFESIYSQANLVERLLHGLIKKSKSYISSK